MNVALWIAAGVLATVLLISTSKAFVPREKIAAVGGPAAQWVEDFSPSALRAIATLEFLAAAGLIPPAALDIAPVLVPLGRYRYRVAVYRRGNHAPPPRREGNDRARPGLSRHGRIRGVGPLRPRVLQRLTDEHSSSDIA
jgi:DoxX-like family